MDGETKQAVCVNCLEPVDWKTYNRNDHVCDECYEILGPVVDGAGAWRDGLLEES